MIQADDTELLTCETNQTTVQLEKVKRNFDKVSSLLRYVRECREDKNMPIGEYVAFEEHLDTHMQFLYKILDIFSAPMNWTNPQNLQKQMSVLTQHVNDLKDVTVSAQKLIQHPLLHYYRSAILDVINYDCSYWFHRQFTPPAHWQYFYKSTYLQRTLEYECPDVYTGVLTNRNEGHDHNTIVTNLINSIPETQQFIYDTLTSFIECTDLVKLIEYNGYALRAFNLTKKELKQAVNEYTTDVKESATQHHFLSNTTAWPHHWAVKCKIPKSNDMEELRKLLKSV